MQSDDILERVDEYSLYCHYLGYEPVPHSGKYRSPIRIDDEDPSFGIFYSEKNPNREFLWKDSATGQVGDIFRLIQLMHRYPSSRDAEKLVINQFGLGEEAVEVRDRLIYHPPPPRLDIDIRVVSRAFSESEVLYWQKYNITPELLSIYHVTAVDLYWLTKDQELPTVCSRYTFAYRIGDKYKIYKPFAEKNKKFRNNFTDEHIEGLAQLRFNQPLLVITKAMKDVMFLRSIGLEAIAPRSENTPIQDRYLKALEKKYRRIVTLFDNDGKHRADYYPDYPELHVPLEMGEKDPTDVAARYGVAAARDLVYDMLAPWR